MTATTSPPANGALHATCAFVLAGGRGERLKELTSCRAKPALPFGGRLRLIDITLGNCVNSGLRHIHVLTQCKAHDLIRHLARTWGGTADGVDIVPAQQQTGPDWYSGTANAVFQNLDLLDGAERVLVLAGDHVYKMDYRRLVAEHVARGADATVACVEVPLAQASAFGVVGVDAARRIVGFDEKPACPAALPGRPGRALVSMGVYVFDAAVLKRELGRDACAAGSGHDFGADLLPALVARGRVFAHDFADSCVGPAGDDGTAPYWRDVGTLDAYWQANLALVGPAPPLDIDDAGWPLRGAAVDLPPARFAAGDGGGAAQVVDSLVAGGCVVRGAEVRRSLLFAQAEVGSGSVVEDSLLLPGARLGRRAVLQRVIVDAGCTLPDGIRIGVHPAEDRGRFTVTTSGVTLVTQAMLARRLPGIPPTEARP